MEPAGSSTVPSTIRPEPYTTVTPKDADAYFAACEVLRRLKVEVDGGGTGRRAMLLKRALPHARQLVQALAPLAGIGA
jgi:hypothetical protein